MNTVNTYTARSPEDLGRLLETLGGVFGSLQFPTEVRGCLAEAVWSGQDADRVYRLARLATEASVPVEKFPYPQRATYGVGIDFGEVMFTTPGGVAVTLRADADADTRRPWCWVTVDFGRRSVYAASRVAAGVLLWADGGSELENEAFSALAEALEARQSRDEVTNA